VEKREEGKGKGAKGEPLVLELGSCVLPRWIHQRILLIPRIKLLLFYSS